MPRRTHGKTKNSRSRGKTPQNGTRTRQKVSGKNTTGGSLVEPNREMVAEAAYFLSEARGFEPGGEVNDWLEAEKQLWAHKATST